MTIKTQLQAVFSAYHTLRRVYIPPHRRITTLTAVGTLQGRHVNQMRQRVEPSFGFALRSVHYLQKFR